MNLDARLVLLGSLVALGAGLGCNNSGGTSSSGASTTGPAATAPPTSRVTTAPPSSTTNGRAPTIASLSTATAPVDGGTRVTVKGTNFAAPGAGDTLVVFGTSAALVTPTSDTQLDVTVPASFKAGLADVRVVNSNGVGILARSFTYTPRGASLAFLPSVGHYELGLMGTKITLSTKDFGPVTSATTVTFGATPAASIALVDSQTLVAEVPDGLAPGSTVAITVVESGRQASAPGFLVQGPLAYGDLTVNELCANPSGADTNGDGTRSSSADEFVEIVNTTANPIDLTYLVMYDGTATERHRFPNPTMIPAGGALVVFGAGSPEGFAARHLSGHAQAATSGMLALGNASDTVEIRTLPGLAPKGTTLFLVNYTNPPAGGSLTNLNDGQPIRSNPATSADYRQHSTAPGAVGPFSPGKRVDGSPF